MYAKKGSSLKVCAVLLAIVLLIGCGIGGTLAWLKDASGPITNTFTTTGLSITLAEPNFNQNSAKLVPGTTITKDPTVTVTANSEDCYVFVKIENTAKVNEFLEYTIVDTWKKVPDVTGVYYRTVSQNTADQKFPVLLNNQVSVKTSLTKEDMANNATFTMEISAYAIQKAYLKDNANNALTESDIADIWTMAQPNQAQ